MRQMADSLEHPEEQQVDQLFRVPSGADLFPPPEPLPTPRELHRWESDPVTLAYLRLLQGSVYDERLGATNERELAVAEGIARAITLQQVLREVILKGEESEDGNEGTADQSGA